MKIRSDFVTNSSSSSYTIEISAKFANGETEFFELASPCEESGDSNVNCSAQDVLKCKTVQDLIDLLNKNIVVDEDCEDDETMNSYCQEELNILYEKIKNNASNIEDIEELTFERTWNSWGEGASCFGANLEAFAEEMPDLARAVVESEGEEKEKAIKAFSDYLENFTGSIESEWGHCFPAGFMDAERKGAIVWEGYAKDIEEFAQMVVDENLPYDDFAVETTTIYFKEKRIEQNAEYLLKGY